MSASNSSSIWADEVGLGFMLMGILVLAEARLLASETVGGLEYVVAGLLEVIL